MLENIYTTKMSANKKQLQNRFAKIRSHSGRISKMMSFVMAVFVAVTFVCATVVLASVVNEETEQSKIEVKCGDDVLQFDNKPFMADNTVYLPLRELLEKAGLLEHESTYINGDIIKSNSDVADGVVAEVSYHDGDSQVYKYPEYTIIKNNTIDENHDVYIDSADVDIKIKEEKASPSSQNIVEDELQQKDLNGASAEQSASFDKANKNNRADGKTEENDAVLSTENFNLYERHADESTTPQNINNNIEKKSADEKKTVSSSVSDEGYIGFEQIVMMDTDSSKIQKSLQDSGKTYSQNTSVDLSSNYTVADFSADKRQVTADSNGNISVYMAVDSENLFDVQITDSETNEEVEHATVLANNDNAYSFQGLKQGKNYDVKITSKTENDWDVNGHYILY